MTDQTFLCYILSHRCIGAFFESLLLRHFLPRNKLAYVARTNIYVLGFFNPSVGTKYTTSQNEMQPLPKPYVIKTSETALKSCYYTLNYIIANLFC